MEDLEAEMVKSKGEFVKAQKDLDFALKQAEAHNAQLLHSSTEKLRVLEQELVKEQIIREKTEKERQTEVQKHY